MTLSSPRMPMLFIGHGSPMLAITPNQFTPKWREAALKMPTPTAVLCISAHWQTENVVETSHPQPPLIYDFYGFPDELYQVQYPASTEPKIIEQLQTRLQNLVPFNQDKQRGFDHGCWAVMKHLYPNADIPVIQLSLCRRLTPQSHIALARNLAELRRQGVLILGSGNLIHNLRLLDWQQMNTPDYAFDWARRAQHLLLDLIEKHELSALANYHTLGEDVMMAINSGEHFLPLLYILALREQDEPLTIFNQEFVGGSLDMTCLQIG